MMSKRFSIVSLAALLGVCMPMFSGCDFETAEKQCKKGDRYLDQKNYAEAVKWYRKAAERGHAPAQCMLGFCYEMGLGVPKDVKQARYWYRKSVAQGYSPAKYKLEQLDKR